MALGREIELKFDVKHDTLRRLEASELLMNSEAVSNSIPSVYFDTDGLDLHNAGLSLPRTSN
jgi:inorganic triphosphatase YgiF